MINEVLEVQDYLNGNNIKDNNLYRICYMLAKWYKEQGLSHVEIRQSIFDWGKKYNKYIKYNVNNIIYQALEDKNRLKDNVIVKINQKDIDEINKRFDSKNTKLVALAVLCYAKAYANRDKEFAISSIALACWINMKDNNLRQTYIRELIDFGYIVKVENSGNIHTWKSKKYSITNRYQMSVVLSNSGDIQLVDNNIFELYNKIFAINI